MQCWEDLEEEKQVLQRRARSARASVACVRWVPCVKVFWADANAGLAHLLLSLPTRTSCSTLSSAAALVQQKTPSVPYPRLLEPRRVRLNLKP